MQFFVQDYFSSQNAVFNLVYIKDQTLIVHDEKYGQDQINSGMTNCELQTK